MASLGSKFQPRSLEPRGHGRTMTQDDPFHLLPHRTRRQPAICWRGSPLDESLLDHKGTGVAAGAFLEAYSLQDFPHVAEHLRAAAQHGAVLLRIDRSEADVLKQLAGGDEIGDAAAVAEWLARYGRIVDELLAHHLADQLVAGQLLGDALAVRQLRDLPAAVHQNDLA